MKNIIKFVGIVAGIVAASVVIDKVVDKVIDKAYESVAEEHPDCADVDASASTCKTVVKAAIGATALVVASTVSRRDSFVKGFEVGATNGYIIGAAGHASSEEELRNILRVGNNQDAMTLIVNKIKEVSSR